MADTLKYSGLCETCEHDATCTLRRSSRLEIIQCEEFSIQPVVSKAAPPMKKETAPDPDGAVRMGLCANCLNVVSCGFPNARNGVLQCEEYVLDESGVVPPASSEYSRSAA
jgi:hypothetical protein